MIRTLATLLPRVLHPVMPSCMWRVRTSDKRLFLTFDDGPSPESAQLLDTLDRFHARATFFLLGSQATRFPDSVREMVTRGHTVGGHGYTHLDAWKARAQQVTEDFAEGCERIEAIVGQPVRLVRPPYGHLRPALVRWAAVTGRRVVLWDVMPADYLRTATASDVASFVQKTIVPGSIVVLHDNPRCTARAVECLKLLLPVLEAQGWSMEPLRPQT